jgi:hypothetical protein
VTDEQQGQEISGGGEAVVRDSLPGRFWAMVVAPREASKAIAARPAWLVAGLVYIVVIAVYAGLTIHVTMPENAEYQLDNAVSQEQADLLQERIESMRHPSLTSRVGWGLLSGIGAWLFGVLLPGLIYHPFLRLSNGQGRLPQTIGVVSWASLVASTFSSALKLVLVLGKGTSEAAGTGLVLLFPDARVGSIEYTVLALFGDVFIWWQIALFVIGFAVVHRLSLRAAATVTIALAIVGGLIMVGFQAIGSRMGG